MNPLKAVSDRFPYNMSKLRSDYIPNGVTVHDTHMKLLYMRIAVMESLWYP